MIALNLNGFNGSPWLGGPENLGGWIDAAAAAGFAFFAPDCPAIAAWLEAGRTLPQLAARFRDAGTGCAVVTVAALLDGSAQQAQGLRFAARAADALGAAMVQVNVAAPTPAAQRAALEQACATLAGTGLKLAIEYMPTTPLATLADTLALVDAVGTDHAGALIDIWHHAHDPRGWETLATIPLAAIAYAEFDDARPAAGADLAAEMLHRRTLPGQGTLDCARFAGLLAARGYTGMISVEVLDDPWRGRPVAEFAAPCHRAARHIIPAD